MTPPHDHADDRPSHQPGDDVHDRVQRVEETILFSQHEQEQLLGYVRSLEQTIRTLERRIAVLESLTTDSQPPSQRADRAASDQSDTN
jgi:hypothetical protein